MVSANRPMLKVQAIETAPDRFIMIRFIMIRFIMMPCRLLARRLCDEAILKPRTWASKRRMGVPEWRRAISDRAPARRSRPHRPAAAGCAAGVRGGPSAGGRRRRCRSDIARAAFERVRAPCRNDQHVGGRSDHAEVPLSTIYADLNRNNARLQPAIATCWWQLQFTLDSMIMRAEYD